MSAIDYVRVVIYTRVSSQQQEDDGSSLDTQLAACRSYAAAHGYTIVAEYTDTQTGTQYRERHGLSLVRALVRAGDVDVVLCHALDRLSRDQTHTAVLVDEIEHHGARLELVTESFDDSATGKLIRSVQSFAAEVERTKIVERSSRGRRARVASGKPLPGPRAMYGYQWADDDKSCLVPHPDTAPVVQRIYAELAGRGAPFGIARRLTDDGVPTPTGRSVNWRPESIRELVQRPHYAGRPLGWVNREEHRASQYVNAVDGIPLPPETFPALVDERTWQRANDELKTRHYSRATKSGRAQQALLVNGFVRCGDCGRPMATKWWMGRSQNYACNGERGIVGSCAMPVMGVKKLDRLVWDGLRKRLAQPDIIKDELERYRADDPTTDDLTAVTRRQAEVERQLATLARRVATIEDDGLAALLLREMEVLRDQQRRLDDEAQRLQWRREQWETSQLHLDRVEAWCESVAASLDDLDYDAKRTLFAALDLRVTVWRKMDRDPRYHVEAAIDLDENNTIAPGTCHRCCMC